MIPVAVTPGHNGETRIAHLIATVEVTSWEPVFTLVCGAGGEVTVYPESDAPLNGAVRRCAACFGVG